MREPLSRERVLGAAVALADKDGIAAVTMRRLGAELGVEAMSLYYHLPGKNGLLDGLVESVLGEITKAIDDIESFGDHARAFTPDSSTEWRGRLRRWFLAARTVMLRHPWAPAVIGTRRQVPDGLYQYYERILATLVNAGFSYRIAHRALHALGSMPLGFVQELFAPGAGDAQDEPGEAELNALAEALPHMAAMIATEMHNAGDSTLGWCDSQIEFEFTLDLLLNGLENLRGT